MSLKECIQRDINNIFLNTSDFADTLELHADTGKYILKGSLQSNKVYNNSGNGGALQSMAYTLYLQYPILNIDGTPSNFILSTGYNIAINNKLFRVVEISDEIGLATVQLQAANSIGVRVTR